MMRLHPRVQLLWSLRALITAAVVGAFATVLNVFVFDRTMWLPVAVFLVVLAFGVGVAILRYRYWRYEVRNDSLYLERGVFTRVRTVVPFVRIQHVDSSRSPVERIAGLATTVVYTAGSRGADVTIPGLSASGSDELQERIKRLAIRAEGDDAV
ncbi:PH domain-containing protein [Haloprofundus salilacus]|uniref:PH domain-containing protein n=1 Tax=Haloprofundus salilacus TaxID=2876190 RepID=UPI001CCF5AA2|nr:PH domain-containing protein [Haloprofundus salilacus]